MPISGQTDTMKKDKKDKKDMDTTHRSGRSGTMKATDLTPAQARGWMLDHWNADEIGTDLDIHILDDAFAAIFGRVPDESEDAFGALKKHFSA